MRETNTLTYIPLRWGKRNGSKTSPEKMPNGESISQSLIYVFTYTLIYTYVSYR